VSLPGGRPCPGARVRLALRIPGTGAALGGLESRCDERGGYAFDGLSTIPGDLTAEWNGCRGGPAAFDPGADSTDHRVDLVLDRGAAVAGTIRDAAGAPLGGVLVSAIDEGTSRGVAFTETAADGSFVLGGLEARPHRVRADDPTRRRRSATADAVVPPREGLDLSMEDDPGAPGTFALRVLRPDGAPARSLRLAESVPGRDGPVRCGEDAPDDDGVTRSALAEPGPRRLLVRAAEGYAEVGPFEIARGAETDLGTVRLSPGVEVRGRLLGPDGLPAAGASIFVAEDHFPERGQPDRTGAFSLRGLPPPGGTIRIVHARSEVSVVPWTGAGGTATDLGEVRLRAARGVVRGVLRAAPVPGGAKAVLRPDGDALPPGLARTVPVGPDGSFEFREVPAGRWYAGVLVPAPPPDWKEGDPLPSRGRAGPPFDLPEGGERSVEIALE
jgi:hypothetical protein